MVANDQLTMVANYATTLVANYATTLVANYATTLVANYATTFYPPTMISATFTIFTILSELRRGRPASQLWRIFYHFGESLTPRIPFWLHLCVQASLLDSSCPPRPARHFNTWLTLPPEVQTHELLEAWLRTPKNAQDRCARRAFIRRLEQREPLMDRDQRDLPGLQALGLCQPGSLTAWGEIILLNKPAPTQPQPAAWHIEGDQLFIPFPPDWSLLWELEAFLRPASPGRYLLRKPDLRHAAAHGLCAAPFDKLTPSRCPSGRATPTRQGWENGFMRVLETGLRAPLPQALRAAILSQPVLNVTEGIVLEFSNSEELKRLRRSTVLREHFEHILSPRHVCVSAENAPRLLELLERRGIYAHSLMEAAPKDERSHTRNYFRQPTLPLPKGWTVTKEDLLTEHLRLQQALDILYHAPGGIRPEPRRITPLLMEEHGGQVYVIAYCHTRRAQRTFRLDRIEIPARKEP